MHETGAILEYLMWNKFAHSPDRFFYTLAAQKSVPHVAGAQGLRATQAGDTSSGDRTLGGLDLPGVAPASGPSQQEEEEGEGEEAGAHRTGVVRLPRVLPQGSLHPRGVCPTRPLYPLPLHPRFQWGQRLARNTRASTSTSSTITTTGRPGGAAAAGTGGAAGSSVATGTRRRRGAPQLRVLLAPATGGCVRTGTATSRRLKAPPRFRRAERRWRRRRRLQISPPASGACFVMRLSRPRRNLPPPRSR